MTNQPPSPSQTVQGLYPATTIFPPSPPDDESPPKLYSHRPPTGTLRRLLRPLLPTKPPNPTHLDRAGHAVNSNQIAENRVLNTHIHKRNFSSPTPMYLGMVEETPEGDEYRGYFPFSSGSPTEESPTEDLFDLEGNGFGGGGGQAHGVGHSHGHVRNFSTGSLRTRTAAPAAHSFAYARRRRPSLGTPRSLSFVNGPPPGRQELIVPTASFNFDFGTPTSPPVSGSVTIIEGMGNIQSHERSRSLPHISGLQGPLRTPAKMKKTGLRKLGMKTPTLFTPHGRYLATQEGGIQSIVGDPTSPESVHGVNLFASARWGWDGSVNVHTETTTTVERVRNGHKGKGKRVRGLSIGSVRGDAKR